MIMVKAIAFFWSFMRNPAISETTVMKPFRKWNGYKF
jgi:hypothetical protein